MKKLLYVCVIFVVLAVLFVVGFSSYENDESKSDFDIVNSSVSHSNTSVKVSEDEKTAEMVWIPRTGNKYHAYSNCSNMKNPKYVTISDAIKRGFTPCSKCY